MKKVSINGREFKVIPEARKVEGRMVENWFDKDMTAGIKPVYKFMIKALHGRVMGGFFDLLVDKDIINATSYCDEKDEFNEKRGIEVCASKMDLKQHLKAIKTYNRMSDIFYQCFLIADGLSHKHIEKAQAIEKDLREYYGKGKD